MRVKRKVETYNQAQENKNRLLEEQFTLIIDQLSQTELDYIDMKIKQLTGENQQCI